MKKRLLLMALTVVCAVGAYAVNIGDYVYSNTNRYKVLGANLVTNGDFSADGAWTIPGDGWGVVTTGGPTGGSYIASTGAVEELLTNTWQLSQGTYVVSYWAKAETGFVTAITSGVNYVNLFASADGTTSSRGIAEAVSVGTNWTQIVDTIQVVDETEYLVFQAGQIATGTAFTNFEIYSVQEVYDTRIVERLIAYAEKLLAEPDLSEGQDDFAGIVMMMKEAVADPSQNESAEAMEGLIASFNEEFDKFMDANGGNTVGTVGSWDNQKSVNWKNLTKIGSWTFNGGRWGFSQNDGTRERPEGDGNVATAGIQIGYDLGANVRVENASLEAGQKYFIAIEAQAVAASLKGNEADNWLYGANHNVPIVGPAIYVGNDTLVMRPATEQELAYKEAGISNKKYSEVADTLNGYYWKRYYYIGEVKAGETVCAGFIFPETTGQKVGGRYSLRNPEFRLIGQSQTMIEWKAARNSVITQQIELKNRIDNYAADVADYKWSKDSVDRAIADATPIYTASLDQVNPVDSTSTVPVTDAGVAALKELQASLLAQVNALGKAKNYVANQNAIQESLKDAIADGQATLDDPLNAGGAAAERTALQAAVSEGQALIDNISEVNQYAEFQAAIDNIAETKTAFKLTCAGRNNLAEILIQNGDFSKTSGNKTSADFTDNGWHFIGTGTYKQWQFGSANTATYANQWRGYTVTLGGKGVQTVTLKEAGLYEYRVKAYATNDNLTYRMATANEITDVEKNAIDTTYYATPARVFFGLNGAPDSVVVSKCVAPGANNSGAATRQFQNINGYTAWTYSVFFEKTGDDEVEVEFGFEADPLEVGKGLNAFGFGENHVYFLGDKAKYITETDADLQTEITRGNTLVAANTEVADHAFINVKINRYIADAQAATDIKGKQNAYLSLKEMNDLLDGLVTGINGVKADADATVAQQGIYTLAGVKVAGNAKNLKPGLYIVNGKKYVIK